MNQPNVWMVSVHKTWALSTATSTTSIQVDRHWNIQFYNWNLISHQTLELTVKSPNLLVLTIVLKLEGSRTRLNRIEYYLENLQTLHLLDNYSPVQTYLEDTATNRDFSVSNDSDVEYPCSSESVTALCLAHKIFPQTKLNSMETRYRVCSHLLEPNKDETNKNKALRVIHNNIIYVLHIKSWITNHKLLVKADIRHWYKSDEHESQPHYMNVRL